MAVIDLTDEMWNELIDATNSINENMSYFEEEAIKEDLKERGIFSKKGYFLGKNGLDAFDRKKYDIFSTAFLAPLKPYLYESFEKRGWWQRTKDKTKGAFYFLLVPKNDFIKWSGMTFFKISLMLAGAVAAYGVIKKKLENFSVSFEQIVDEIKEPIKRKIFVVLNYIKVPIKREMDFIERLGTFSYEALKKAFWKTDSKDKSLEHVDFFWTKFKDALFAVEKTITQKYRPTISNSVESNATVHLRVQQENAIEGNFKMIHPLELITSLRIQHINVDDEKSVEAHFNALINAPKRNKGETLNNYKKRLQAFIDKSERRNNPLNPDSPLYFYTLIDGEWVKRKSVARRKKRANGLSSNFNDKEYDVLDENGKIISEDTQRHRDRRQSNLFDLAHNIQNGSTTETGLSELVERTIDLSLINSIKNKLNAFKNPSIYYNILSMLHAMFAAASNFLIDVYFIAKTGTSRKNYSLLRRYAIFEKHHQNIARKKKKEYDIKKHFDLFKNENFYIITSPKRIEVQEKLIQIENAFLNSFKDADAEINEISEKTQISKIEIEKPNITRNVSIFNVNNFRENSLYKPFIINRDARVPISPLIRDEQR